MNNEKMEIRQQQEDDGDFGRAKPEKRDTITIEFTVKTNNDTSMNNGREKEREREREANNNSF